MWNPGIKMSKQYKNQDTRLMKYLQKILMVVETTIVDRLTMGLMYKKRYFILTKKNF